MTVLIYNYSCFTLNFMINMTFYLKPPLGELPLETLQTCVVERCEYLNAILSSEDVDSHVPENFEYLIEGTAMDRAGHFLLRLVSLSSPEFQEFVMKGETELFLRRLNGFKSSNKCRSFLKGLHGHAEQCIAHLSQSQKTYSQFLSTIKYICEKMLMKSVTSHCLHNSHPISCEEFFITLPFTECLPFVKTRAVDLRGGNAFIPCGKWKQLLAIIFKEHVELGMDQLQKTGCFDAAINDPRICNLMSILQYKFKSQTEGNVDLILKANQVEMESVYFPPCMANLYKTLCTKHRLSHEGRRQFTLYLKSAGMPLDESINFWREQYSHPLSCNGNKRSWPTDSKRYLYSIRHMYGLEGGRYNYEVSSCRKIQGMSLNAMEEGGCPFTHFDNSRLKKCLSFNLENEDQKQKPILDLKSNHKPKEACNLYLVSCKRSKLCSENVKSDETLETDKTTSQNVKINNPVEYYLYMKDCQM